MQFFIDSADIGEIRQANAMGCLDGVTTNPSLVAKTGRPFRDVIKDIVAEVKGPVNLEVVGTMAEAMVNEGRKLADIAPNVVVKIPLIEEGLQAVRTLAKDNIRTNVTLCFSPTQALLAAKAGATYISPFIGRLDDVSEEGMELIEQIVTIYRNYQFPTKVLVASVRNPVHVRDAALLGADVCTMPFGVLQQLAKHPLTDIGLERFLKDWQKVPT
ncbi:MAG: fructose-6-phosphate aldolase [Deltaproteobacteria bacterium]|nr:fructose-6-phosphate aldolase [Deltaproteobacteria bacterium]